METDAPKQHVPEGTKITIGEALEATALTAGDKPVEKSDAAAIQAAEVRATGMNVTVPGGIAAQALSAADTNARETLDENKTKLRDILSVNMSNVNLTLLLWKIQVYSIELSN
jgi:Seed maturation protein